MSDHKKYPWGIGRTMVGSVALWRGFSVQEMPDGTAQMAFVEHIKFPTPEIAREVADFIEAKRGEMTVNVRTPEGEELERAKARAREQGLDI